MRTLFAPGGAAVQQTLYWPGRRDAAIGHDEQDILQPTLLETVDDWCAITKAGRGIGERQLPFAHRRMSRPAPVPVAACADQARVAGTAGLPSAGRRSWLRQV